MWNLSSDDVRHAKERIADRRKELEARYAEERKTLDAEHAVIETLERSAAEFATKYAVKLAETPVAAPVVEAAAEVEPAPVVAPETAPADAASLGGDTKHGSRWRLHLGGRPDADNPAGAVAAR